MHDLVARGQKQDPRRIARELGAAYAANFKNLSPDQNSVTSTSDYFAEVLAHWSRPAKDGAWEDDTFWTAVNLPSPSEECFSDGDRVMCNPLWLIRQLPDKQAVFFRSFQHGDLNARNLLLSGEKLSHSQMIDFEKAGCNSPLLDICWLSLSLLVASRRSFPVMVTVDHWCAISEAYATTLISGEIVDADVGPFQVGLDLASDLIADLHRLPMESQDDHNKGFLKFRISEHIALTLGAAALAMAFYQVRSVDRAMENGKHEVEKQKSATLWAICFFRIAAHALSSYASKSFVEQAVRDTRILIMTNMV